MMVSNGGSRTVAEFVPQIYDTIADPGLWPQVLDRFAEYVDARGCIVFEWRGEGSDRQLSGTMMSSGYELQNLINYLAAFSTFEAEDQDRFEALSLEHDGIDLIECGRLYDTEAELLSRPNMQALIANDMRYRAAGLLNKDNRNRARFSVQRSASKGPFTAADHAVMGALLPHIAKAMELSRPTQELMRSHGAMMEAMDSLRIGVCVLDERGYVVVSNEEFARQREQYDVFRVDASGRLHVHDRADPERFEEMRIGIHGHGRFGARPRKEAIVTDHTLPGAAICIEVAPFEKSDAFGITRFDGAVLYTIDTTSGFNCDAKTLQNVFSLTNAEAEMALLVGEGLTNPMIAERRDRAVQTVNVQVKALLTKTGCKTRAEFVRLLLGFGTEFVKKDPGSAGD